MSRKSLKSSTLSVLLYALSAAAHADDVHCPPDLGSVTVDGNVLVAAACRLDGTTVKGNVHLYAGGSLIARDAIIDGNIQAENADFIDVADSHIAGSIQLDDLVGDVVSILNSSIDGSVQLNDNRSRLEVAENTVGADIQAFSNIGGVLIADNTVGGNLQCKSNTPPPSGGNNRVDGNKEDQCENLVAESGGGTTAPPSGADAVPTVETLAAGGAGSFGPFVLSLAVLLWAARRRAAGFKR
jgi:hypothetical protein